MLLTIFTVKESQINGEIFRVPEVLMLCSY